MSESESSGVRRFLWPAAYYSAPTPEAVLPRGVTFGCGAASVVVLLLVFGGGVFLAHGGLAQFMDLVFGLTMGDVRGMYTKDVTPQHKAELETAIETLREGVRTEKVPVARLDPVLQTMRKAMADRKMDAREVEALRDAALKASR